ncbi:MAG TPA: hypothetical protein VMB26_08585 [Candidatus Binataceae bacterium]|nr:hypothetical protein [Candidatus Binataceae bacterium]
MDKVTRRELAAALSVGALVAPAALLAQPQASPPQASADDELKISRDQFRGNADQLDKFPLPMATEPATIFKA